MQRSSGPPAFTRRGTTASDSHAASRCRVGRVTEVIQLAAKPEIHLHIGYEQTSPPAGSFNLSLPHNSWLCRTTPAKVANG